MNKVIVTLTGPSCAGKSTLEKLLVQRGFAKLTSLTTRAPRQHEVPGQDYHFVSDEQFKATLEAGNLVESIEFNGVRYGLERCEFEIAFGENKPVVVVVEPEGRKQIVDYARANGWLVFPVFIDGFNDTIHNRFLERAISDALMAMDPGVVIERYARRLSSMRTVEQTWRVEAYMKPSPYALLIQEFNQQSQEEVIKVLFREVAMLQLGASADHPETEKAPEPAQEEAPESRLKNAENMVEIPTA